MKRTVITVKTTNGDTVCNENEIDLPESNGGYHGTIELKIKDGNLVDAAAPVQKLKFKKVK